MKAIVLAGGKSSRMRENKALLTFEGEPLLARIGNCLEDLGHEVYIAGKKAEYDVFPYPQIADIYPNKGPLGGIYSALVHLKEDILVCPCDMPLLDRSIFYFLQSNADYSKINVLTYNEKVFPTLGIYPYAFVAQLQNYITQNKLKMLTILEELGAKKHSYPIYSNSEQYFANINTPEDWTLLKSK